MVTAGLASMWRPASFELVSVLNSEKHCSSWSLGGGGTSLVKRGAFCGRPVFGPCRGRSTRYVQVTEATARPIGLKKQPFVEPQWLLPSDDGHNLWATSRNEVEESTSGRPWPSSQTENHDQLGSLYYITITTAKDEKSGLSEPNAGILLSMIGENGKAIMQKIPGTLESADGHGHGASKSEGSLRFQRGAVDTVTLSGPNVGRLAALWIAPEAGTWRIEKASVTILTLPEHLPAHTRSPRDIRSLLVSDTLKELATTGKWRAIVHLFESNQPLLGDGAWLAAAQLKPSSTQEAFDPDDLQEKLLKLSPKPPTSPEGLARMQAESMDEYRDLKTLLLGFSALLVFLGTACLAVLDQGKLARDFAVGGVGGFLYLLLLQRAVDQLLGSTTSEFSAESNERPIVENSGDKFRQPVEGEDGEEGTGASSPEQVEWAGNGEISRRGAIGFTGRLALVAGLTLVLGRLAQGGVASTISPPELLAGVVGFLTSKVAVVLAALKPPSTSEEQ